MYVCVCVCVCVFVCVCACGCVCVCVCLFALHCVVAPPTLPESPACYLRCILKFSKRSTQPNSLFKRSIIPTFENFGHPLTHYIGAGKISQKWALHLFGIANTKANGLLRITITHWHTIWAQTPALRWRGQKSSKVKSQLSRLYKISVELTFENFDHPLTHNSSTSTSATLSLSRHW